MKKAAWWLLPANEIEGLRLARKVMKMISSPANHTHLPSRYCHVCADKAYWTVIAITGMAKRTHTVTDRDTVTVTVGYVLLIKYCWQHFSKP